jgi:CubicO group peptidase (beta-lactamase class C family)
MTSSGLTVASVDRRQLDRLKKTIVADVEARRYHGAVIMIGRHGEVVLEEAIGQTDQAAGRDARPDDVFHLLSITKSLVNIVVYRAIDHGLLTLNTPVTDVIPEFGGQGRPSARRKERVTVGNLLSHRSGLPATPVLLPNRDLGDLAATVTAVCEMEVVNEPGEVLVYAAAVNHVLLAEMARRVHGDKHFRDTLRRELLDPLGMKSTALGTLASVADRVVPIQVCFQGIGGPGGLTGDAFETVGDLISANGELPWVGGVGTAGDIFRLAEMLRRGGELDGERILSRAVLSKVTTSQAGHQPTDLEAKLAADQGWQVGPGSQGYGFGFAGDGTAPSVFGTLTSPGTFGQVGAGSALFWVDPVNDMTFVCLTAGIMAEQGNFTRFQRLSDMAVAAAV